MALDTFRARALEVDSSRALCSRAQIPSDFSPTRPIGSLLRVDGLWKGGCDEKLASILCQVETWLACELETSDRNISTSIDHKSSNTIDAPSQDGSRDQAYVGSGGVGWVYNVDRLFATFGSVILLLSVAVAIEKTTIDLAAPLRIPLWPTFPPTHRSVFL